MTPARAQRLSALLAEAADTARSRAARIADMPDDALKTLTGIPNVALARRVAATQRVAARLVSRLPGVAPLPSVAASGDAGSVAGVDAVAQPEPDLTPISPPVDLASALEALGCAIGLSTSTALPDASDLVRIRQTCSDDAVAFGLTHRTAVPAWIRAVAGTRADVVRQLAATCLVCARDDADSAPWPELISDCAPLTVVEWHARDEAAAFARAALEFLETRRGQPHAMEQHA